MYSRLWGAEAGKILEKLRNPGSYNYSDGCPRDQLFWCAVNQSGINLAIGSYHGNIYIGNTSIAVLKKKNKVKLAMVKREIEHKYRTLAKSVTTDVLTKATNIMRCLSYVRSSAQFLRTCDKEQQS